MKTVGRLIFGFAVACVFSTGISSSAAAGSITVTNLKPTGEVTSGGFVTVTADVTVSGLPDGDYEVYGSITNQTAGGAVTYVGAVTIKNGTGTVTINNVQVPGGTTGNQGTNAIEVSDPNSGISGAASTTVTWD